MSEHGIKSVRQCMDGLIHYAIERQVEFKEHMPGGIAINPELRNIRTRKLIRGMAELYDGKDEADSLVKSFDDVLNGTKSSFGIETISQSQQHATVQGLLRYAKNLAESYDEREKMLLVSDHFEDMMSFLSWDAFGNRLYQARDWLDSKLVKITTQQSILFTRILLGSEHGPNMSGFVGGSVTDFTGVTKTCLYNDLSGQHPEIESWPAICTVYRAGYGTGKLTDATEVDLGIMRRYGDAFVELEGVSVCSYPVELIIKEQEQEHEQSSVDIVFTVTLFEIGRFTLCETGGAKGSVIFFKKKPTHQCRQ